MWWRIFVLSWTFFDKPGLEPALFLRTEGGWEEIALPLRVGALSLFFNPHGNLNHARNNLFERLLLEAPGAMRPEELISYALVENLARELAAARGLKYLGFKLRSGDEDALVSA